MSKILLTPVALFIFVSLMIHLGIGGGVSLLGHQKVTPIERPIEIEIVDSAEKPLNEFNELEKKQIVEQQKQINDVSPDDAKYLSQFNQKVIRETKAAKSGDFKNTGGSGVPQKTAQNEGKDKSNNQNKKSKQKKLVEKGPGPTLADLSPKPTFAPQGVKLPTPRESLAKAMTT